MEEELLKKIDEISDEMISGIKRIVQIDSVQSEAKPGMPFGEGVNKALEEALKLARELGFETENVDHMVGIAKYGIRRRLYWHYGTFRRCSCRRRMESSSVLSL